MNEQIIGNIKLFYGAKLIKRALPAVIEHHVRNTYPEDFFVLTELGMPSLTMENDFSFSDPVSMDGEQLLIIGRWWDNIYYNISDGSVFVGSANFLAASVANLLRQVHFVDWFWTQFKPTHMLGHYRADANNKRYAKYFQNELLAIDPNIFAPDSQRHYYYWGALLEDLEHGIVG